MILLEIEKGIANEGCYIAGVRLSESYVAGDSGQAPKPACDWQRRGACAACCGSNDQMRSNWVRVFSTNPADGRT